MAYDIHEKIGTLEFQKRSYLWKDTFFKEYVNFYEIKKAVVSHHLVCKEHYLMDSSKKG